MTKKSGHSRKTKRSYTFHYSDEEKFVIDPIVALIREKKIQAPLKQKIIDNEVVKKMNNLHFKYLKAEASLKRIELKKVKESRYTTAVTDHYLNISCTHPNCQYKIRFKRDKPGKDAFSFDATIRQFHILPFH